MDKLIPLETIQDRIGNPIFAIETNLHTLRFILEKGDVKGALNLLTHLDKCVEQAKERLYELRD